MSETQCSILHVGNDRTPVIMIDDFYWPSENLMKVVPETSEFSPPFGGGYPGVRAPLPDDYITEVLRYLEPIVRRVYSIPSSLKRDRQVGFYSLVSTPEHHLSLLQCVPHTDTRRTHYYAILHYLSAGEHGGTGFYRHIPTGLERIAEDRYSEFVSAAKRHMIENGVPEQSYMKSSDDHFQLVHSVAFKKGRLVLYPGNLLHSGMIDAENDINGDPTSGRLTANIFVDYK